MAVEFAISIDTRLLYTLLDGIRPRLYAQAQREGIELISASFNIQAGDPDTSLVAGLSARKAGWSDVDASATVTVTFGTLPTLLGYSPCDPEMQSPIMVSIPALKAVQYSLSVKAFDLPIEEFWTAQLGKALEQLADLTNALLRAIPTVVPYQPITSQCPFPGIPVTWTSFRGSSQRITAVGGLDVINNVNRTASVTLSGPGSIVGSTSDLAGGTAAEFTVKQTGSLLPDGGETAWMVTYEGDVVDAGVLNMTFGTARFLASFPLPEMLVAGRYVFDVAVTSTETSRSAAGMTLTAHASQQVAIVAETHEER